MENNPYAPPLTSSQRIVADRPPFEVRGKYLLVRDEATLPMRCIKTNQEVGPTQLVEATYHWAPPFRLVIAPTPVRVHYYVSDQTQRELYRRRVAGRLMIIAALVALTLAMWIRSSASFSAVFLLILGLATFLSSSKYSYLRVVRYRDGQYWFSGCGRAFLASCQ